MNIDEIIKYLTEHLQIEIESAFEDCSNNQEITVRIKIGNTVISESSTCIFIED